MTQFTKAHWSADENTIRMSMDFSKVDKQRRLVSGFATLDNIDSQDDIVLADASRRAFERARGNLREMHKKDSAVGKVVKFKEKEFIHKGQKYRGIFVTARVSEGAQDTWLKVLDGTLTGFSIGGSIIDSEEDWNKDSGKQVRVIKDYELVELSLVDNPANQLANIFSIQKNTNGSVTVKGMVAETQILNVFYCEEDEISVEQEDDNYECPVCEKGMKNIGWIENGPDRTEKVNSLVTKFLGTADADSEGGVEMSKNKHFTELIKSETVDETGSEDETVETGHERGEPSEVPTPAEPAQDAADDEEIPAEDVEEVHDEGEEISKKIDELKEVVEKTLDSTRTETREQVEALETKIDQLSKSFDEKTSEFQTKFEELDQNLNTAKSRLATFEKNLERYNSSEALKKSADYEGSEGEVQKSNTTWNGAFSVDTLLR